MNLLAITASSLFRIIILIKRPFPRFACSRTLSAPANQSELELMASEKQRSFFLESASCSPIPPGVMYSYGIAGFCSVGLILGSTMFGLMITASHNPIFDNGVKIADPDGGMMTQTWEPFAGALANAPIPNTSLIWWSNLLRRRITLCVEHILQRYY
ncbi:putative phosphoacetylglucosamine mutase [Dioscorea sansibarensis]